MVQRINVLWYNRFILFVDSNHLFVNKTESPHLALVGLMAGKLADELGLDFEIYEIFFRLNYLDFYFVDISAMLLVVLEGFSRLLSNKAYFKVFLWCIKVGCHYFHIVLYY